MILIGAFTVIFEAYTLGAVISTYYNDMIQAINDENIKLKFGQCINTNRMDTLFKLTWASVVMYVAILVVGHWSGLDIAYKREKRASKDTNGFAPEKVYAEASDDYDDDDDDACI